MWTQILLPELKPPSDQISSHTLCFSKRKNFLPPLFLANNVLRLKKKQQQQKTTKENNNNNKNKNRQTLHGGGVREFLFFREYLSKLQLPNKFYADSRQKQTCF